MIKKIAIVLLDFLKFIRSEPNFLSKLRKIKKSSKKLFLIGTPIHGNLGDHLIAEAEKQYLLKQFSDYEYIECTMPFSRYFLGRIIRNIDEKDLVFISGGGWLGSEWKRNENFVRELVKRITICPVIILPQTVFYKKYDEYAESGKNVYENNPKLLFCTREKNSYDFLLNHYFDNNASNIFLMPDFALFFSTDIRHFHNSDQRIRICFRDDIELSMSEEDREKVMDVISKYDENPEAITTNTNGILVKPNDRIKEINRIISKIANSKLLVTDRLHAMIMAAISGTPCLAFDNSTHKVGGVFSWIQHLDYVCLCQPEEDITEHVVKLLSIDKQTSYDSHLYDEYLNLLSSRIRNMEVISND